MPGWSLPYFGGREASGWPGILFTDHIMKKSLLARVAALVGLSSVHASSAPASITPPPAITKIPKDRYRNTPPPPPQQPRPVEDLFVIPGTVKGWDHTPPRNQRRDRKARRRAHAAGKRNAFR